MLERLQVLELPLCGLGALRVGLVKDLGGADAAAVVHVGRQVEATAPQLGHEVDLLGGLRLGLKQTDAILQMRERHFLDNLIRRRLCSCMNPCRRRVCTQGI